MNDSPTTLYERIGGEKTVISLVDAFYQKVLSDPELSPFFEHTSMEKLQRMQREFFSAALDGPQNYSGRPLSYVHHGRGITKHHFALFVQHLLETLQSQGINDDDTYQIIDRISTYVDEITGGAGGAGG